MGKNTIWFILGAAVLVGLLAAWRMAFVLGYAPSDPATSLVNPTRQTEQTPPRKASPPPKQPPGPIGSSGFAANLSGRDTSAKGVIDQSDDQTEGQAENSTTGQVARAAGAPELTIEVERLGKQIVLRGKTDIPLESGSLTARAYRVYTSADGRTGRRIYLDARRPPLEFETRLDTGKMVKPSGLPEESLDRDKVYIEVEFVGPKADPGSVPGLSFAEMEGGRRRYRVIRTVPLPLSALSEKSEAKGRINAAAPAGKNYSAANGPVRHRTDEVGPASGSPKQGSIIIRPLTISGEKAG